MTDTAPVSAEADAIVGAADRIRARGESARRFGRDPVNLPMINNWVEAIGDGDPVYTDAGQAESSVHGGLVAPPAMAQVWTMGGLHPDQDSDDPLYAMMSVLDEAGYSSVVATNCDQTYHRYLRHGERVALSVALEEVVGPKRTALGEGWFVTTRNVWYVEDEPVAEMRFRVLKFRPGGNPASAKQASSAAAESPAAADSSAAPESPAAGGPAEPGAPIMPAIGPDTAYFWEGAAAGELRIQRCGGCGLLRHPPGPMCPECAATKPTYLVACGAGEVYSYVVHHRPPVPGKRLPLTIALVELDEGVRMLGELHGIDPKEVHIGLKVRIAFQELDEQVALPYWIPRYPAETAEDEDR